MYFAFTWWTPSSHLSLPVNFKTEENTFTLSTKISVLENGLFHLPSNLQNLLIQIHNTDIAED